ncbi:MAG: hypothetical protein IKJ27_06620 [Clostridia bacterium]|nr:hypothetical protein [Clostridia bacterium]
MKYLSLSYTPTPEDFVSYANKSEGAVFALRAKRMIIPFGIIAVAGLLFDVYYAIIALSFFICATLVPAIINREYIRKQKDSQFILRPMCLDFYDDHIVQTFLPGGRFKGKNEKHFGFKAIAGVIESEEYIWFLTKAASIITIPKRELDEEKYGMIKNLIENCFSGIYTTV